ncbi:hypothetical protein [Mucilaginibacter sp. OK098]|uniref:hypothetical protein n=1 Tax=Mucilaginibacter sp. OK098 TaxID=1855297 RepID=UPI0009234F76|nr:hypothetical protein [Mucilaginibacter sp. OK098]SHN17785.1 hypothetical protein SAMN05216524_106145 [Mucilaginibacter sp. OK098]
MKKIYALVITLLITAGIVNAQDGWVTHKGDNRVSVKFPTDPKELVPGSFIASDKDSIAYIFTIVDFVQVAGIDSVALAPIKATPEFAAQLKTGMNQSLPDVNLEDFSISTWKGFTSYHSTGTDSKKKNYDLFMFIIGNKLYSVSTIIPEGVSTKGREFFSNSIQISN